MERARWGANSTKSSPRQLQISDLHRSSAFESSSIFFWQNSTPHCNLYYIAQKVYCELMWIVHFSVPHVESVHASSLASEKEYVKWWCQMMPAEAGIFRRQGSYRHSSCGIVIWTGPEDSVATWLPHLEPSEWRGQACGLIRGTIREAHVRISNIKYYMSYNIYRPCKLDAAVLACAWCRGFAVVAPHTSQVFALLSTNDEHVGSEACSSIQLIRKLSLSSAGMELGGDQQVHGLFARWQVAQFGSY